MDGSAFLIIFVCFLGYFIPAVVARLRKFKNPGGLFALNLFLGWTIFGWLAALIWAALGETEAQAKSKAIDYAQLVAAMKVRLADLPVIS